MSYAILNLGNRIAVVLLLMGIICQPLMGQKVEKSISDSLIDHMQKMGPADKVDVLVELEHQVSDLEMSAAKALPTKKQRRVAVIAALKNVASHSQPELLDFLNQEKSDGQVEAIKPLWIHNFIAVRATSQAINELANREDVAFIRQEVFVGEELFPVQPRRKVITQSARRGQTTECGVALMRAPEVWDQLGYDGSGITVAVIDTGVCFTHPDLANREWVNEDEIPGNGIDDDGNGQIDDIHGWNFRDDNADFTDDNSHGTHCSGTVAGTGADGVQTGMAPGASIMALKFWNDFDGESVAMNCVQYAVDNDADVISSSWGWPGDFSLDPSLWRMVMENAMATGVVTVFAAGNEGASTDPPNAVRVPGNVPDIITVGATNCSDDLASFSSPGPVTWENVAPYFDWPLPDGRIKPDVSAPGVDTTSTLLCAGYVDYSGTSMACPHVAGAAALILSKNPELDHFDVKQIMMDAAVDLGAPGMDNNFGMGRLDAFQAVQLTPSPSIIAVPDSHVVVNGDSFGGDTVDLQNSDDVDLSITRSNTSVQSLVVVDLKSVSSIEDPSTIEFTFEASVFSRNEVTQTISMYNYDTSSFEQIDSRNASRFTDGITTITIDSDASRFVEAGTGCITAQIQFEGDAARRKFTANMDQAMWMISN